MKAKTKDLLREIKHTFNRYLSILAIMALGVAFFAGIRASEPDMRATAKNFYDETSYMDIWVAGTLGLTEDDVREIEKTDDGLIAEGMYTGDAFMEGKNRNFLIQVKSLCNEVNRVHVTEGRTPINDREVFVDSFFMSSEGLSVGDEITLFGEENETPSFLKNKTYTIVGYGTYAEYLSWERGTVSIGNGSADAFMFLDRSAFTGDAYSYIYVTADGADDMDPYGDTYEKLIDEKKEKIEKIADDRCVNRREELINAELEKLPEMYRTAAKEKISDAVPEAKWFVLDRNSVQSFVEFGQDAERIGKLGLVFPTVFFIVATLVSLTTMTRMVEDERTQIGTYKALGYSKSAIMKKYLAYSLSASLIGGLLGAYVGQKILPLVIIAAYKILYYHLPETVLTVHSGLSAVSIAAAVGCTVIATIGACYYELKSVPAVLMRPSAPKAGKRILLERIPFIWKHLSFSWKASCRNLFRYKKRLFMTIFGIGGCMALLNVGFGLRDSVGDIVDNQYKKIWTYDMNVTISGRLAGEDLKADDFSPVTETLYAYEVSAEAQNDEKTKEINLFVPEDLDKVPDFLKFRDRKTDKKYELKEDGVFVSEKLARQLSLKVGDVLKIKRDNDIYETEITAITENYLFYYVYMSPAEYERLFSKKPEYNQLLMKYDKAASEEAVDGVSVALLKNEKVTAIKSIAELEATVSRMMKSLDLVIIVLIISAGLLAFIVIYNLNNINIIERRRELATIQVLGFYDNELAMYVYRENIWLTVFGVILGVFMGYFLHKFVIETCEIDMIMFGRDISAFSYLCSVLLTFLFAAIVNGVMFFSLKKIDMVESLKSAE